MNKCYSSIAPATFLTTVLFTPLTAIAQEPLQRVDQNHLNDLVTHDQGNIAFLQARQVTRCPNSTLPQITGLVPILAKAAVLQGFRVPIWTGIRNGQPIFRNVKAVQMPQAA